MSTNPSPIAGGAKPRARLLPLIVRILMGLPLVVFGLNGLFNFLPQPKTPIAPGAMAFLTALMNTGYMMPLIGLTFLAVGVLLLANRFVPLALVLLAPFLVNSIAFHACLEHTGLPMAAIFLIMELYLVRVYWPAYRPLLVARTTPA